MGWQNVLQLFLALGSIIFLANIILKKLNRMQQGESQAITIIERTPISKSSALCIVEIAGTYYLMSVSDTGNEVMKELSKEEQIEIDRRVEEKRKKAAASLDFKKQAESSKQFFKKLKEKYYDRV